MKPFLALSKIVLFYALPQVLPHLRAHQKDHFSTLLSFTKSVVKKSRRRRFVPSDTSDELLGSFRYPFAPITPSEGFQQQATRVSPQMADLYFLRPPPHNDTPSLRNSFTSQTPQESQRLQPTSPLIAMTKTLFFPSRRRSYSRGYAIPPHRWAALPRQSTPISEGIESLRATANTAYTFSSRYKRKRWTAFSRCAKRRIIPVYFSLFSHYFSRKVVHFPAKVVLFFHPLLAPLSFPPDLPNEMGHFPTLSHSFLSPAQALFPFCPPPTGESA